MNKALPLLFLVASFHAYSAQDLRVSLLSFNGAQREAYDTIFEQFSQKHTNINLVVTNYEAEKYKSEIGDWLQTDKHSDIMYWFGGERLRSFVKQGLVKNLDETWQSNNWDESFTTAAKSSVSFEDQKYGLPVHYYPWAMYYKKSLFERLGIVPPTTWEEFISTSNKLKENQITPIVVGSKNHWTLAAWFDYLNLRLNGLEFHLKLMNGDVSYKDNRVIKVFEVWSSLATQNYFLAGHQNLTWREALPFLYRNKGGIMLMGNFWTSQIPPSLYDDIGMIRFPIIDSSLPVYEEAPTNVWMIPDNTQNKEGAITLMEYLAEPQVQEELNSAIGMIAPSPTHKASNDYFINRAYELLAKADGSSQFFDRDTLQPIASKGIEQFSRFVSNVETLPDVLEELERLRIESKQGTNN
ncbi:extracellular solute-binding protein [Vibrio hannami]|uniref:ABC transporter substrate-binding protein n=1 Tax=Vibrio hannami TaxID=2717094 RepID=UPI00240F5498|nr:extracellular solute-binding protein [Vibrio hannami]MDG3085947.1 extracellular solute-binding protein [Vibrio hannami]